MRLADEGEQLRARVALVGDRVADVRAVEARHEHARAAEREPLDDLLAGLRVGGGRERDARHIRVALVQHGEQQVVRPEVVAPLRDAVRLVDGEERDARLVEQLEAARRAEPLGRHVQQVELAREQLALDGAGRRGIERRVQELGADAELRERGDLVLHQRDQRRDHHGRARPQQRRELVAQRLAAARRHEHQCVAARDDVLDDLALRAVEVGVPEDPAQQVEWLGGVAHCARSVRATSYT